MPNIVAFRIDERLIHGQGQIWIKALGANTVIVANDAASEDPIQQQLMKAVVPKTIAMRFFSVQKTCDLIHKASPKQVIFMPVKEINVGNIHRAPGKEEISKFIALGPEDKAALRELRDTYGITFNTKATATGDDGVAQVNLNDYL